MRPVSSGGKDWLTSMAGRGGGGGLELAEGAWLNVRHLRRGWGLMDSDRKGQSPEQRGHSERIWARSEGVEGAGSAL